MRYKPGYEADVSVQELLFIEQEQESRIDQFIASANDPKFAELNKRLWIEHMQIFLNLVRREIAWRKKVGLV